MKSLMWKNFLLTVSLAILSTLIACGSGSDIGNDNTPADSANGTPSQQVSLTRHSFPQHVSYTQGSLKVSHRTQAQQDDDVRAAYDKWKASYLAPAPADAQGRARFRVKLNAGANEPTVSEGQGYGMIIVALMGGHDPEARNIVDGLWRFTSAHRSEIDKRLPDWFVNADETPDNKGNTSAFDGEADLAYGLLLADAQWGSDGEINYRAEALTLIQAMKESEIGPNSKLPLQGDWVDPQGATIDQYYARTSDFMYGHFRAYARATGDTTWLDVVASCQSATNHLQANYSPNTGLLPDFMSRISAANTLPRPADKNSSEGPTDDQYAANAGRVPWRFGTDWLINGDNVSRTQVQKISQWAKSTTGGNPLQFKPGYQLNGAPIPPADYYSTFYVAPLGVAAMATPGQEDWLNAIYDAVRNETQGYYEDSITLLSMLVMTGNFWDPTLK